MARFADGPVVEVFTKIGASPAVVWDLVTDINLPARFQDEFQEARWTDGDGPSLGASFVGRNRLGTREWETTAWVVAYEPKHEFGWAVSDIDDPGATWTFRLEPSPDGTTLKYHRRLGPGPSGLTRAIERHPEREEEIIAARAATHRENMQAVIDGVKAVAEDGTARDGPARGDVVGVVLGAGLGERMREGMGRQKQLLAYAGTTLLGAAVAQAEASSLDRVIVVLGADADDVAAVLEPERATIAYNPDYRRGNLSSLLVGVDAAGEHGAIVHLVGDMPGVDASLIDLVVGTWRDDPRAIAVTRYRDRVAHPFVLSSATTARLDLLQEPKAIWRLIQSADPADVLEIEIERDAPIDVDTREDYEQLLAAERDPSAGEG